MVTGDQFGFAFRKVEGQAVGLGEDRDDEQDESQELPAAQKGVPVPEPPGLLLDDRERLLSAWCNAKGRVICLLTVRREESGYRMFLPAELAEDVLRRLTMFRFRSKVDFEINPATSDDLDIQGSVDDWLLDNLRAGRAEIWKPQSEEFTPHMLNLDLLGAVSFDKGCYPGQEIVARTHYRGATKRRTHRFTSSVPVTPGDKVSDGERDIGEVLNAIGTDLLAVIPSEKANDSLTVNGVALIHIQLEYL